MITVSHRIRTPGPVWAVTIRPFSLSFSHMDVQRRSGMPGLQTVSRTTMVTKRRAPFRSYMHKVGSWRSVQIRKYMTNIITLSKKSMQYSVTHRHPLHLLHRPHCHSHQLEMIHQQVLQARMNHQSPKRNRAQMVQFRTRQAEISLIIVDG